MSCACAEPRGRAEAVLRDGWRAPQVWSARHTPAGPLLSAVPRRRGLPLAARSEEHTSELQSLTNLVCRLLLEKKKNKTKRSKQHTPKQLHSIAIIKPD